MALQFLYDGYFAGSVGIGTNTFSTGRVVISQSGGTQLHLISPTDTSGSVEVTLRLTSSIDYRGRGIQFDNSGAAGKWFTGVPYQGGAYSIGYHATQPEYRANSKLFINTSGDVGIGTVSPSVALQLGNSTLGQTKLAIFNSEGGGEVGLTIQSRTNRAKLRVADNDSNAYVVAEAGKAFFGTSANGDATNITVLTSGNVGIGTTSPNGILQFANNAETRKIVLYEGANNDYQFYGFGVETATLIYSTYTNTDDHVFVSGASSTTRNELMRIEGGGNVGIGTASPTEKLVVQGSNHFVTFKNTSTTANTYAQLLIQAGDATNYIWTAAQNSTNWAGARSLNIYTAQTGANIGFFTDSDVTNTKLMILGNGKVGIGTNSPGEALEVVGNIKIQSALLSNQENTDVDTGTETVAEFSAAAFTAGFFDFVIKKGTNVRSGTVYACHDGTNVEFTETSTQDLGDTSDVTLSVDISGGNMRLLATVTSDDWSVKSLIRAI